MNYFRAAEQLLTSVPTLEQALGNIEIRLQRLTESGKPHEVRAVDLKKEFTTVHAANDVLEDYLAVAECTRNRDDTKGKLNDIKRVLEQLPAESKKLLELWYIKQYSKHDIMSEMYVESPATIYKLRNKAVAEFALMYYGASAIGSI